MQHRGSGVVAPDGVAALGVDACRRRLAHLDRALAHDEHVPVQTGQRIAGVDDVDHAGSGHDLARVAHLATGLGVEGCAVEEQPVAHDADDRRLGLVLVATGEERGTVLGEQPLLLGHVATRGHAAALGGRPGPLALVVHGRLEAGDVDAEAAQLGGLLGDLEGEPVGVVQLEGHRARQGAARLQPVELGVEDLRAAGERAPERLLSRVMIGSTRPRASTISGYASPSGRWCARPWPAQHRPLEPSR